jgi:hypothetical protein
MLQSVGIIISSSSSSSFLNFYKSSSMHIFRSLPSMYIVVQHTFCRICSTHSVRMKFLLLVSCGVRVVKELDLKFLLFYFLKMLHQEMEDCFCCCVSLRFLVRTCLQGTVPRHRNTFIYLYYCSVTQSRNSIVGIATGYGLDD